MIRAQQVLHEILLMGIDEEPQEVRELKARALIEKFKADSSGMHQGLAATHHGNLHVANELRNLRDAVDREIDRRVDEDLIDHVYDLLEPLSDYLYAETGAAPDLASAGDAHCAAGTASNEAAHRHALIAEAAYRRAEQRHFEPGHDLEDWLAAEGGLGPR
jgi:hypothetical protein